MAFQKAAISKAYTEVTPYQKTRKAEAGWRDGMVTGNGEQGVVCSGSPYSETHIYQNMFFIMPTKQPRFTPPQVTGELHEARQAVIHFDDAWNVHDRKRTYLYCFHPGHQLRLNIAKEELFDYVRKTEYETAEIVVQYTDRLGAWERRTFTSRADNASFTRITKSSTGNGISMDMSIDDISSMKNFGGGVFESSSKRSEESMLYKKRLDGELSFLSLVAHYPSYEGSELKDGGYAGVTKVIVLGGTREFAYGHEIKEEIYAGEGKTPILRIRNAQEVILITKADRTHQMGRFDDFAAAQAYDIEDGLKAELNRLAAKYTNENGQFSYDAALKPHKEMQAALYNAVTFRLGDHTDKELPNEALIEKQKTGGRLLNAFVERAYNQGRYAQIACAGTSAPRLCGLWTGEWNPGWNGAYTMDANVNLQVSGMNTGNVYDAAIGLIYFVLRQIKDWEENAALVYGMKDALLIPVNTDGDVAVMVEYDEYYPFQYWNAGASWMLLPIFEFWQCFGNRFIPVGKPIQHLYTKEHLDLEKDILYPLVRKQANFWQQLCTPEYFTDIHGNAMYEYGKTALLPGEKYIILPSYSPENKPNGYNSTITANAAMDIAAARDGLKMMIQLESALRKDGYQQEIEKWEHLLTLLPEYQFDETGALREWAMKEYKENNEHRHISHLYCAWPGYEAQNDEKLASACNTAIANRNRENMGKDDTASHGWVHKALVAARLKNAGSAYDLLHTIMSSNIFFTSMMTDHNTDRSVGVYCTDTSIGTVGIINEMLLYSNSGEIELLPALPDDWSNGDIHGLMARTQAQVTALTWDLPQKKVHASILSLKDQTIKLSCRIGNGAFITANGRKLANGSEIHFAENEETTLVYHFL